MYLLICEITHRLYYIVMGRATLVHQHCAESSRGKPRIGACIALRKNHVTDTGTVSFGCAAPKCVYQETNCINMSWVCRMEFCLIMDRSRKFSPVWNNFDFVTPNKVNLFLLYILFFTVAHCTHFISLSSE